MLDDDKKIKIDDLNDDEVDIASSQSQSSQITQVAQVAQVQKRRRGRLPSAEEAERVAALSATARLAETAKKLEERLKKCMLTRPKFVMKAANAVEKIIAGEAVGRMEVVKGSDVLRAAEMIYDRFQPAVRQAQNLNVNANANVDFVDLSAYLTKPTNENIYDEEKK